MFKSLLLYVVFTSVKLNHFLISIPKGLSITRFPLMSQAKLVFKATGAAALATSGKIIRSIQIVDMLSTRANLGLALADHCGRWSRMIQFKC
jgi:hypothetical protein